MERSGFVLLGFGHLKRYQAIESQRIERVSYFGLNVFDLPHDTC
jgi:hypothetical protein